MYQLSAPRLNKEGSLAVFLLSLDEQIEEGFGGIVKKAKNGWRMDLFLKTMPKQLSRCGDGWSSFHFGLSEISLYYVVIL